MVTIALFDTLLALQSEQLMIELILKHLAGAPHIPIAQKHKINKIQAYAKTVDYFLDLSPEVMKNSNKILAEHKSLDYQQPSGASTAAATTTVHGSQLNSPAAAVSMTIGTNWNHYGLHANGESLYSNYHAYLYDAHQKIKQTKQSCDRWLDNYFYKSPAKGEKHQQQQQQRLNSKMPNDQLVQMIRSFLTEFNGIDSIASSASATIGTSDLKFDSLQSIGESSGYESMKYRPDDDDEQTSTSGDISQRSGNQLHLLNNDGNQINATMNSNVTIVKNVEPWRISRFKEDQIIELEFTEDIFSQGTVSLGEKFSSLSQKFLFHIFFLFFSCSISKQVHF